MTPLDGMIFGTSVAGVGGLAVVDTEFAVVGDIVELFPILPLGWAAYTSINPVARVKHPINVPAMIVLLVIFMAIPP